MWQPRIANVRHRTGTTARPVVAPVNLIEISAGSSLLFLSRQKPMVFGDRPIFCLATVSYRASPWTIPPSCSIPLRDIVHLLLPRIFFSAEFSTCSINFSPFRETKVSTMLNFSIGRNLCSTIYRAKKIGIGEIGWRMPRLSLSLSSGNTKHGLYDSLLWRAVSRVSSYFTISNQPRIYADVYNRAT